MYFMTRFLDRVPSGSGYIALCFVCRVVEATGGSMAMNSAYAILTSTLPDDVGRAVVSA